MRFKPYLAVILLISFAVQATPLQAGIKAPAFKMKDINGKEHSLEEYQGKVKVLYFWASWCPGCVKDTASVNEIYSQYQPKGVEFISVSLDTDIDKLKAYVEKNRILFPVLFEGKAWDNELAKEYMVNSTPSFFIISPEGELWGAGHWSSELSSWLGRLS